MARIEEIENSISANLIKDSFFKREDFNELPTGGFEKYAGGFSVAFPTQVNNEKWAFRCWTIDLDNIQTRLEKLSSELRKLGLDYFCDFEYVEEGILVNGQICPITKMKWIEGSNIKDYLCANRNNKDQLLELARNFYDMCIVLHNNHISHGDLQHGNIIVDKQGKIFLIDYDSVYLPNLGKQTDIIHGLKDYQHPQRFNNVNASEKVDYFSELVIYLSILAIAENPLLVDKYLVEDADRLLFEKGDFDDLENSQICKDLNSMSPNIIKLLGKMKDYLSVADINDLKPFEFEEPIINISCNKPNLISKNKETSVIEWKIEKYSKAILKTVSTTEEIAGEGRKVVAPEDTTDYIFVVTALDNVTEITKSITIRVLKDSKCEFDIDRIYSFPGLAVKLTWKTERVYSAIITDGKKNYKVGLQGELILNPVCDTIFTFKYRDDFGDKEIKKVVKMLPIPMIKELKLPQVPIIEHDMNIQRNQMVIDIGASMPNVSFPKMEINFINENSFPGIRLTIPFETSLTEKNICVKLEEELANPSFLARVKNYLKDKFTKHTNDGRK